MTIYIWCPRPSESANRLKSAIRYAGVRCIKARFATTMSAAVSGDLVVNYGSAYNGTPLVDGVKVLNGTPTLSKRTQLLRLYENGVNCPEVYSEPGDNRLGRNNNHAGGTDLLDDTGNDYWTQRIDFTNEFRIHVFNGMSVRAGIKVGAAGAHPWIRSHAAGWHLSYGKDCQALIRQAYRDEAKKAVAVLGLDFGAVDVGIARNGLPVVLEVNLAPGLEGRSVDVYTQHILGVANGH